MVVQQVDRVVDRQPEQGRSEGEGDAVELPVDEAAHRGRREDPEHARQQRETEAPRAAQGEQQDRADPDEGKARDLHGVAPGAGLSRDDVAREAALAELEGAAVLGVDPLEGRPHVAEQRGLHARVEARGAGREEEDRVAPVAGDELAFGYAQGRLHAPEALEEAPEGAERVGRGHLREQRPGRQAEVAAQAPGFLAQALVREQLRDFALGLVREEQQAPREVELVDAPRELGVGAAAQPGDGGVAPQRVGQRAPPGDGGRLVGPPDGEDHGPGQLGVAQHAGEHGLLVALRVGEEGGDVRREADPRQRVRGHRRHRDGQQQRSAAPAHGAAASASPVPNSAASSSGV